MSLANDIIFQNAVAITAGASVLTNPVKGLSCAVAGTATVNTAGGQTAVVVPLAAGQVLYLEVTHVTAATATGIVGYW